MTTLKSKEYLNFLEFLIRFMITTKVDSKSLIYIRSKELVVSKSAWWKCLKRTVSRVKASCSSWLLLIIIFRVPEICALKNNSSTLTSSTIASMTSLTYHATMLVPTANIVNSVKEKFITVSEKDKVIMGLSKNNNEDYDGEDSDEDDEEEIYDYNDRLNYSANGMMVGSHCEYTCDKRLRHVFCNPRSKKCECEKNYPVSIGPRKGCEKPKKLGEQCFYDLTCLHNDENSVCMQINHNAICDCKEGYHIVTHLKPTKRTFCTQDSISPDLPTLLGVSTGIFVLAGLICMVLHLFSKTKYPRTRNFADAHHAGPPVFFASDTGIPLTIQSNRPSSRSSQRSTGSIGSTRSFTRRSSGILHSKGVNVSQSRQGSARSAAILLYSYHLTQLNALNDKSSSQINNNNNSNAKANNLNNINICSQNYSNHFMAKYIEQQLEDQKRLLYLEIPALKNHNSLMRKLRLNLKSESDLSQLDTYEHAQHLIGNNPLHRKLHRKLFKRTTTIDDNDRFNNDKAEVDERSGVANDLFPNKSTDNVDLNGSSESRIHNISLRTNPSTTDGGYTNPMAFSSFDDLDDQSSDYDSDNDERKDYHRTFLFGNQEIIIAALPTPASEGPSIAVAEDQA
ncbi:hypothetical protein ACKWTF_002826 [Chironomus riparius]